MREASHADDVRSERNARTGLGGEMIIVAMLTSKNLLAASHSHDRQELPLLLRAIPWTHHEENNGDQREVRPCAG